MTFLNDGCFHKLPLKSSCEIKAKKFVFQKMSAPNVNQKKISIRICVNILFD